MDLESRRIVLSSETKDADQLCSYCEADLHLCFRVCRLLVFPCGGSNNLERYVKLNKMFVFNFQPAQAQSLNEAAQEIRNLQSVQLAQVDQEKVGIFLCHINEPHHEKTNNVVFY